MSDLLVSILILTFARTKNLEESIYSALNQNYKNYEVLVLNGCKEQKLFINNPKVKIINIDGNDLTISKKRNMLIDNAKGEILTPLDDDDLLFPWHLEQHVNNIIKNNVDVSLSFECTFWERKINKLTSCLPYTANLAHKNNKNIRYIDDKHADFDQHFRNHIQNNINYKTLKIDIPSYIYCWNNDVFHMCGLGNEQNLINNMQYRLDNGIEPTGNIEIVPRAQEDVKKLLKV